MKEIGIPADDPRVNPQHLANIPAGHARDEENRRRTDSLAEKADAAAQDAGSIQGSELMPEEREILQNFNPWSLELEVSNPNPDRCPTHHLPMFDPRDPDRPHHLVDECGYKWVLYNSTVISAHTAMGYQTVKDPDKEAFEHRGQHKAAGSSLRGVGDVILMWIPPAKRRQINAHYQRVTNAKMAVEENWEQNFNQGPGGRHYGPLAHGNPNDPLLKRTVFRGNMGQVERIDAALRTGKNFPAGVSIHDE